MASECKIEYYFRKEELKRLIDENEGAKGVIVSMEINKEKPNGAEDYVAVAHIKARMFYAPTQSAKSADGEGDPEPDPEESIDGCPYPPGCTP
ncbi:MAG: hypothetical protein ABI581_12110 [Sediminibacterium sp.]